MFVRSTLVFADDRERESARAPAAGGAPLPAAGAKITNAGTGGLRGG